jgi:hypothetical protein
MEKGGRGGGEGEEEEGGGGEEEKEEEEGVGKGKEKRNRNRNRIYQDLCALPGPRQPAAHPGKGRTSPSHPMPMAGMAGRDS